MKTCSFFDHRDTEQTEELKQKVRETVERLIVEKGVDTFLVSLMSYAILLYSYVISVNSVATIRSQFKTIYDSGALTNGGKVGEKIGLDTWARMDKPWTW